MSEVKRFWSEDAHNILRCVRESDYDAALAREASLREELKSELLSRDYYNRVALHNKEVGDALQQRLTVAEQRAGELEVILGRLIKDCLASDFNEHWDSFISAESALRPATEPEHICKGCGSKGWTANCDQCVPY